MIARLDIRIYNESLDLGEENSVSIEENNPAFSSDIVEGSFSVPFTIPASDYNSWIFGFPERLKLSTLPKLRYPAELWIEGKKIRSGEIIFRSVGKNKYTINFQSEISLLAKTLNDIKLQDLAHTDITLVDFNQVSGGAWGSLNGKKILKWNMANSNNLPNPFKVTVNGKDCEDASDQSTTRAQNVIDQVNAYTNDTGVQAVLNGPGLSVEFRQINPGIDPPLEVNLFDYTYWTPDSNRFWITKYEPLFKAVINSYKANVYPTHNFVFPIIKNEGLYPEKILNESGYQNYYLNDTFKLNVFNTTYFITDLKSPSQYSLCPMFYLRYVFDKIEEKAGIKFIGKWINDPDIAKLIIYNNRTIDHFEKVYNKDYNYYHNTIKPAEFLPNMSVNEFLLELKKLFNLTFDFNQEDNTFEIISFDKILTGTQFIDFTNRTNPDYEFEFSEPEGATYNYKFESKDELYKKKPGGEELAPYILARGKKIKESAFSTLYSTSTPGFKSAITLHPGGRETSDFSPRLLFYYGLQPSTEFKTLLASYDDTNFSGDVLNKYTLAWLGPKGLYNTWHIETSLFEENTQLVKFECCLNIVDLMNFSFKTKIRIDQVNYIAKKITYTGNLSKGLLPVKFELYKCDV